MSKFADVTHCSSSEINPKTGQMIGTHPKRQPDLMRNPSRAQVKDLVVISRYWEKGMNNSLSLAGQSLPLLVNFTSEILDSFKPKPQPAGANS